MNDDDVAIDLLVQDIRDLGLTMIRFETWEREAKAYGRWQLVSECQERRELVREQRSALMLTLAEMRKESD